MKRKKIDPRVKREMIDRLREVLGSWDDWKDRVRRRDPEFLRYLEVEMVGPVVTRRTILWRSRKEKVLEARRIIDGLCKDMAEGREPLEEDKTL